ncbi:MAG TPA: hypothetical protein DEP45_15360 [Armatimonadetes bacterium]|nr:hypothetical protein [Armatimonadota bacterium]
MRSFLDYLIYMCAFCVIGVGALGAWEAVSEQPRALISPGGEGDPRAVIPSPNIGKMTILLMGADERPQFGDKGRSDTMILLFVSQRTKKAALLSIPRDLRVHIPGHGRDKINAAYAYGGVELARDTIEQELGVHIDAYAKADFQGFVEVVDQLGGVTVEVPDVEGRGRGMNYDDNADGLHVHLKPGLQTLNGEQAIGFVRYRKGDSDFKRSERQQQFLKAMAEQKLKLSNIVDLARVVPKAFGAVETDIGLRKAGELAQVLRDIRSDSLLMTSFQDYLHDVNTGIYYVEISAGGVSAVLGEIERHLSSMPDEVNLVDVLNGSGAAGVAATVGSALSSEGFEINDTGNATSFDHARTQIYYPDDGIMAARRVQRVLGTGDLVKVDEQQPYPQDRLTIVTGEDIDTEALGG